ncbi:MAG: FtsQ-type POTRA domain-containing protein [Oscillospiraceae bacterium]
MRDIVKSQPEPPRSKQTRRRRKRNMSLYYLLVFIMVFLVGFVLSTTVLFKITDFEIEGKTRYTNEEIIAASHLKIGNNLIRSKTDAAEEAILKELVYVDSVKVERKFPAKISIELEPSTPFANVKLASGAVLASDKGKVLESTTEPTAGYVTFTGYAPINADVGEIMKSEDAEKDKLFLLICEKLKKLKITNATGVDITDRFNIILVYENRITVELGSQTDLEYKLKYTHTLVEEKIGKNKEGTLSILGDNGISFVEKDQLERYEEIKRQQAAATTVPDVTEPPKAGETTPPNTTKNPIKPTE